MTTKEQQKTLERAIRLAGKNGWRPLGWVSWLPIAVDSWQGDHAVEIALLFPERDEEVMWARELEGIIFNHDFAKALWGEQELLGCVCGQPVDKPHHGSGRHGPQYVRRGWQYHLQMMVIAEDPLTYLSKNLPHD